MSEYKPVRARRSTVVHATHVDDLRMTACGVQCDGWTYTADEVPNCRRCLRILANGSQSGR